MNRKDQLKIVIGIVISIFITECGISSNRKTESQLNSNKKSDNKIMADIKDIGQKEKVDSNKSLLIDSLNRHSKSIKSSVSLSPEGLNDLALEKVRYSIPPSTSQDTLILTEAVKLLNSAIYCDSTYYIAYANKAWILSNLGANIDAITVWDLITLIKPGYAEGYTAQGFLYEKIGNTDSANAKYKKAINAYSIRLLDSNNIGDAINQAFIISLIDNKRGAAIMDSLIMANPDDNSIKFYKQQLFDSFNREIFIKNQ